MKKFLLAVFIALLIIALGFIVLNHEVILLGIDSYSKSYFLNNYASDLNSNLSIFPADREDFIAPNFSSTLDSRFFGIDGYIILDVRYEEEKFHKEIERLSNLKMTIKERCYANAKEYTNDIRYDNNSYKYPAYVTIDGFKNIYEYALIDQDNLRIMYVYLAYPDIKDIDSIYLKKDISFYSVMDSMNRYSMYMHSFDGGKSFSEFDDC